MYPNKMSTSNTKPIQKVTNKKGKYKKMTADLKEKLRILFIQGVVDSKGFRDLPSIRDLANDHQVSENTLYKLAQRENWHEKKEIFQNEYEKELDQIRIKEFVKASKKQSGSKTHLLDYDPGMLLSLKSIVHETLPDVELVENLVDLH